MSSRSILPDPLDVDPERVLALARRILASLPPEDPADVRRRRRGEATDGPPAQLVRGADGLVRWVSRA